MINVNFDFTKSLTKKRKAEFSELMIGLSRKIGFKVSSRGWAAFFTALFVVVCLGLLAGIFENTKN